MRLPPDFEPDDENADDDAMCRLVGSIIIAGLFFVAMAIMIFALTGCGSTFYDTDGKPTARITGNFNYHRTPAGSVTMSINHSQVIDAHGRAAGIVGSTVTAFAIAAP